MFKTMKENPAVTLFINFFLSYLIHYSCANMIWQYFIYYDTGDNENYRIQENDSDYLNLNTILILTAFVYICNFVQYSLLTFIFSRHFTGINLIIHKFMLLYVYLTISSVQGTGCKKREWLTCYKNETTILTNDSTNILKEYIFYGVIGMTVCEILFSVLSYIKNYNKIYYCSKNGIVEIIMVVALHYVLATIYCLILMFMFCLMIQCNCDNDNNNNNNNNNNNSNNNNIFNNNYNYSDSNNKYIYIIFGNSYNNMHNAIKQTSSKQNNYDIEKADGTNINTTIDV